MQIFTPTQTNTSTYDKYFRRFKKQDLLKLIQKLAYFKFNDTIIESQDKFIKKKQK